MRNIAVTLDKGVPVARSYDRRTFLGNGLRATAGVAAVGGAGGLLEACGGNSNTVVTTVPYHPSAQVGVGKGNPVRGGTLTIGTEADEAGFDPTTAHFDSTGVMYARTVFDPLAITLADGTIVPYLAQSITPNAGYTAWTVTVRPNVVFHDGTPCDGAALVFNIERFLASPLVNFALTYVHSVTQAGPLSMKVTMNRPWVSFDAWLAGYIGGQIAYVFSPKAYKAGTLNKHPVGTGPFVFESWIPNQEFKATANPNYWRKDAKGRKLPYLDAVHYLPIPIVASRLSALQSGSLDLMHTDDDPTILQVRSDKSLQNVEDDKITVAEPDMNFLMLNVTQPPLNDIRIRQAMAYAFNQSEYLRIIGREIEQPSDGLFPPGTAYHNPNGTGYPTYNLAKAVSLVQAWSKDHGGTKPLVAYKTTNTPESQNAANLAQSFLAAAGIQVTLTTEQQANFIDDAVLGNFHVFAWRQFANVDPDLNYVFWSATSAVPHDGIVTNFARNADPVIQKAMDTARQSADHQTRVEQYQTVERRLAKDLPYIWAGRDVWSVSANSSTQNFNNPTAPGGRKALGMLSGIIWPTEVWKTA